MEAIATARRHHLAPLCLARWSQPGLTVTVFASLTEGRHQYPRGGTCASAHGAFHKTQPGRATHVALLRSTSRRHDGFITFINFIIHMYFIIKYEPELSALSGAALVRFFSTHVALIGTNKEKCGAAHPPTHPPIGSACPR